MNRSKRDFRKLGREIARNKYIYLIMSFGIFYLILFSYVPMRGLLLAFKDYKVKQGILGSPWVGLAHFERLFREADFRRAFVNTLQISFGRILFQFPFPILIAILVNELRGGKGKKALQTIYTFPHFLSWVIVAVVVGNVFESDGAVNQLIQLFGGEPRLFLADKKLFRPLLYFTDVWKESGWSSIIYLSAISAISGELYEAAAVDGANWLQRIVHITLPGIRSTVIVMLLLAVGGVMNGGFDQIFNMSNPAVQKVSDIIDTYIYRITFTQSTDFGFSTAVGLFKSVINFALLVSFDYVARRFEGRGIME